MQTIKITFIPEQNEGTQMKLETEVIIDPEDLSAIEEAGASAAAQMLVFWRGFMKADLQEL